MSDTPRTDELAKRDFITDGVWIRHARELERENAKLRAHAERVGEANDRLVVENGALRELVGTLGAPNHINVPSEKWRELQADKERVDYVEKHLGLSRDALDVAMEVSKP